MSTAVLSALKCAGPWKYDACAGGSAVTIVKYAVYPFWSG